MAKYDNNYIEQLNRQLAEAQTRLEILTEYTAHWQDMGHYSPEPKVLKLILGIPLTEEKGEDGYAE